MVLELIAEGIVFVLRIVLTALFGTVFQMLFYWPGWVLLRIITLGRYPPSDGRPHNRFAVALFFVVAAALFAALFLQVGR